MPTTPLSAYRALLQDEGLAADPGQAQVMEALEALSRSLAGYRPRRASGGRMGAVLARLGLVRRRGAKAAPPPGAAPCGLYLHGGVGRGKSMLMDLFFRTVPVAQRHRRRVHFHAFMLEVHERLHAWRRSRSPAGDTDPLIRIAEDVARRTWLLCFDEFQVTNVADAMILSRLFTALFERGVVMVATSNLAPDDLYRDGLQRERFLPFIALLKRRLKVLHLDGEQDYRMARLASLEVYFTPADAAAEASLDGIFRKLTDENGDAAASGEDTLSVQGRVLTVPRAARGVAWFTFEELCGRPLGAADYLAIANAYHSVLISGIPALRPEQRDRAARFVTLIDALYEHRVKLVCSAEARPEALYPSGDVAFAFARTVSRLIEMQSREYKALDHVTRAGHEARPSQARPASSDPPDPAPPRSG